MKKIVIALTMALAIALPLTSQAELNFSATPDNTRVRVVRYTDNTVVRVVGYAGSPTVIEFGKSETVEDVAGGSIIGWDIAKVGNRVFVVPLEKAKPGTIIVATNKHSYVFDIVPAYKGTSRSNRVSKVMFSYGTSKEIQTKSAQDSHVRLANRSYSMELVNTSVEIRPMEVLDDGKFTYFYFPKNTDIPIIYESSPGSRDEWLTSFHKAKDGAIVVHGIAKQWNLRLDKAIIGVFNDGFTSYGYPVETSPSCVRGQK